MAEARQTAAQVVGKVGALDLARKEWPELIPQLQANVAAAGAGAKQATLAALGYVCEDLDANALEQAAVNTVLTAVVAGMGKAEEAATRVVATRALDNALVFASANFKSDGERNYIMQMVCEGAVASEHEVRGQPARRAHAPAASAPSAGAQSSRVSLVCPNWSPPGAARRTRGPARCFSPRATHRHRPRAWHAASGALAALSPRLTP